MMSDMKTKALTITENADAVKECKETLKSRAEKLVVQEFPQKIVALNEVLMNLNFEKKKLSEIHQDVNIPVPWSNEPRTKRRRPDNNIMKANEDWPKVYTLPNGPSPCNRSLDDITCKIKPHIRQLIEDSILLKMWISYLIPRMEDGNDFGCTIQGIAFNEIQQTECKAEEFLDQISGYFMTRAKIVSKVAKYPHIDDYRRAVRELDEKQYLSLWQTLTEIRNRYCVLHDLVTKNFEKIKKPETTNLECLY